MLWFSLEGSTLDAETLVKGVHIYSEKNEYSLDIGHFHFWSHRLSL